MVKFFKELKEAIVGTEQDFTEVKLSKAILLLSIPMVLEMVMESTFAVVDIVFVQKLGSDAVAIVGLTESLISIVYSIAWGLSMSTTSIVSRRFGEKNYTGANNAAFQSIITGSSVALVLGGLGYLFSKKLLALMGASPEMITQGWTFTSILIGANVIIMMLFINNAIFRSSGDAAIALRILFIANVLNIILDPCLIFGWGPFPELGLTGAAVATTSGRAIAVLVQFYYLYKGKFRIKLGRINFFIDWCMIRHILMVSLGGIGQNIIATASWIFMVRVISGFGSVVVASYTIAIRIILFALLPSWGLSNAASTLVGQNLGAKKPERAERAVKISAIVNFMVQGVVGIIFILFPEFFIKLITSDASIIPLAADSLRIISYGFFFYGVGMVMVQAFNGAGDTTTPTLINIFCFWLFEIPLSLLLSYTFGLKENGVYYSIVIAESTIAIIAYYLFRKGNWKLRNV
jgi:putative MATE family efflux protein